MTSSMNNLEVDSFENCGMDGNTHLRDDANCRIPSCNGFASEHNHTSTHANSLAQSTGLKDPHSVVEKTACSLEMVMWNGDTSADHSNDVVKECNSETLQSSTSLLYCSKAPCITSTEANSLNGIFDDARNSPHAQLKGNLNGKCVPHKVQNGGSMGSTVDDGAESDIVSMGLSESVLPVDLSESNLPNSPLLSDVVHGEMEDVTLSEQLGVCRGTCASNLNTAAQRYATLPPSTSAQRFDNFTLNDTSVRTQPTLQEPKLLAPSESAAVAHLASQKTASPTGRKKSQVSEQGVVASVPSTAACKADEEVHVLDGKSLNKALDLLKNPQHVCSKKSSEARRLFTSGFSTTDIPNKKLLLERLGKLREEKGMASGVPHLERAHLMQMANLLQRFNSNPSLSQQIPNEIRKHVFAFESQTFTKPRVGNPEKKSVDKSQRFKKRLKKRFLDPDATESSSGDSDVDVKPSTSDRVNISENELVFNLYASSVQIGLVESRSLFLEDEMASELKCLEEKVKSLSGKPSVFLPGSEQRVPESCSRCLPFDGSRRRYLKRTGSDEESESEEIMGVPLIYGGRLQRYSRIDPRVHSQLTTIRDVPVERRIELCCYRKSTRPAINLRKRLDRTPWSTNLEDRKVLVKEAVIVEERQKTMKLRVEDNEHAAERGHRIPRCDTYHTSSLKRVGQKLVKRSIDRRRYFERKLHKVPNRVNKEIRPAEHTDDLAIPHNCDYKEIIIPPWVRKPMVFDCREENGCSHLAESSSLDEISKRHLPYELDERKRFQLEKAKSVVH